MKKHYHTLISNTRFSSGKSIEKKLKFFASIILVLCIPAVNAWAQQNCGLFCNGGADSTILTTSTIFVNSSQLTCWQTTAPDGLMEVWASGFNGVPSYSGPQFFEL